MKPLSGIVEMPLTKESITVQRQSGTAQKKAQQRPHRLWYTIQGGKAPTVISVGALK